MNWIKEYKCKKFEMNIIKKQTYCKEPYRNCENCPYNGKETNVKHTGLGPVKITEQCKELQKTNPDPTSIFVEHKGHIKEVTKSLVKEVK